MILLAPAGTCPLRGHLNFEEVVERADPFDYVQPGHCRKLA